MRAPLTPAAPASSADEMPSPTMLAMAASIMHQQGKFDLPEERSQSQLDKQGIEIRREMEEQGMNKRNPKGERLDSGNDRVPSNKGLLAPWNRRT